MDYNNTVVSSSSTSSSSSSSSSSSAAPAIDVDFATTTKTTDSNRQHLELLHESPPLKNRIIDIWLISGEGYYTGQVTNVTRHEMYVSLYCGDQVIQWHGPLSTRWRYNGAT